MGPGVSNATREVLAAAFAEPAVESARGASLPAQAIIATAATVWTTVENSRFQRRWCGISLYPVTSYGNVEIHVQSPRHLLFTGLLDRCQSKSLRLFPRMRS